MRRPDRISLTVILGLLLSLAATTPARATQPQYLSLAYDGLQRTFILSEPRP